MLLNLRDTELKQRQNHAVILIGDEHAKNGVVSVIAA